MGTAGAVRPGDRGVLHAAAMTLSRAAGGRPSETSVRRRLLTGRRHRSSGCWRSPDPFAQPADDVLFIFAGTSLIGYGRRVDAVLHAVADQSRRTVLDI